MVINFNSNDSIYIKYKRPDSNLECMPCTTGLNNQIGSNVCVDGTINAWTGLLMQCMGVRSDGSSCAANANNPNGWQHVSGNCPDPSTLPPGWHPDLCGKPNTCPGQDTQ